LFLSSGCKKSIDEALFNDCVCAARYEVQADVGQRTGRDLVSACLPARLEVPELVEHGRVVAALDKKAVRKIVHACWLDETPERCMQMLSDLQRVLGRWQQSVAFSVGIEDCLVDTGDEKTPDSFQAAAQLVETHVDPNNAFKTIVDSGAKGSIVNIVQISTCVGQQVRTQYIYVGHQTKKNMGCFQSQVAEDEYTKTELLHDNILLSYKLARLKKQKVCALCLNTLHDHYMRSTSKEAKSKAATYGTASSPGSPRTSSSRTPEEVEKGWSILR